MTHYSWKPVHASAPPPDQDSSAGTFTVPVVMPQSGGPVLTVGAGEMFATLSAALAVATDGTTILVDSGTYNDDFATVSTSVTIVGVGGMANFTADTPPPNAKGILTVDNNVTIANCTFSGAAVSDANGGNGAGIRYEGGQMSLENCALSANQDGILAFPVIAGLTNTISIDHCLFNANGSGTGYTHNLYVGDVASLIFTNNISEGAIVGHEFKSRALVNDIENNVFMDGPAGTASYSIDLPNGGQDTVLNNVIEKGPAAQNQALIHFGGEGIPYAGSSLLVSGNQFINDFGASAVAVLNQTPISATIAGNSFANFDPANIAQGPATETGNLDGNGNALPDQTLTGVLPGNTLIITDANPHNVTFSGTLSAVEGGAGLLTAYAAIGHVIAIGGAGGLDFSEAPGSGGNTITTLAGATDTIRVSGQDLIDSEGNDTLSFGAGNVTADLNGTSMVTDGTGNDQFSIAGTTIIQGSGGSPVLLVGPTGSACITGSLGYLGVQNNGGSFSFSISQGGVEDQLSATGGAMQADVYGGTISATTAGGATGALLHLGAGTATILSAGADTIFAGSGADTVIVEGAACVYAGSGSLSVFGRSDTAGASVFGNGGTVTMAGDTGNITYYGGALASTVQAQLSHITLMGGAGRLTVNGGSGNLLCGGTGGLIYNAIDGGGADTIVTQTGMRDTLNLGAADIVSSSGNDVINGGFGNQAIALYGNSVLNGSTGNSQVSLSGTDTLNGVGFDACTVSAGAVATINAGSTIWVSETQATVKYTQRGSFAASATLTGGAANLAGGTGGALAITTQAGNATNVTLTGGTASVATSGQDTVRALGASANVAILGGTATIYGGNGALSVFNADLSAADTQTVIGGRGSLTYTQETGTLNFIGGTGSASIDGSSGQLFVIGGSGALNVEGGQGGEQLTDGTGALTATLTSNGATVIFGAGASTITEAGFGAADIFNFGIGHGNDFINNFRLGTDVLNLNGLTIKSETVLANATRLVLSDNTHVYLNGVFDTGLSLMHH